MWIKKKLSKFWIKLLFARIKDDQGNLQEKRSSKDFSQTSSLPVVCKSVAMLLPNLTCTTELEDIIQFPLSL